jgi:hypothetical protein
MEETSGAAPLIGESIYLYGAVFFQRGLLRYNNWTLLARLAAIMNRVAWLWALTAATPLALAQTAHAHGIAGNRYFDGTLGFDDPAVADEAILPLYSQLSFPTQGSNVGDNRINWAFARLLTPTLAFTADGGWVHQNWPIGHTSGADKADIGLKSEAYRNNQHEALISVGVAWGIGHTGARGVGADAPNTIQPGVFFRQRAW